MTKRTPRPKIIPLTTFLRRRFPKRQNILAPILPLSGLAMLSGPSGIGKTHAALGIGIAVATGGTFLNWKAPKARNVLLLDSEMAPNELQGWLADTMQIAGVTTLRRDFNIISDGCQKDRLPNLMNPEMQRNFYGPAIDKADLIIIDNLVSFCGGQGENWPDSLQSWILSLRRKRKAVLMLVHAGKNKTYRGSSRQIANLDTLINLKYPSDYQAEDGCRFIVQYDKHRTFYGKDAKSFEARLQDQQWVMANTKSPDDQLKARILAALKDRPHSTRELYKVCGDHIPQTKLWALLSELVSSSGVESFYVPSGPKGGRPATMWRRAEVN